MAGMRSMMAGIVLLAALASTPAQAALITFEPDDYAAGTALSNVNPHVSLSTFRKHQDTSDAPVFGGVFSSHCRGTSNDCASTGEKVFGDSFGGIDTWGGFGATGNDAVHCFRNINLTGSTSDCGERFNMMLMTFNDSTDFVQISGKYWANDETYLYGLDDSFNFIGQLTRAFDFSDCSLGGGSSDYCGVTSTLTSATGGIRYVFAGGWSNGTSLDNLRFNTVPEPGTLALLALGLAGVAAARRRRLASPTASA